MTIRIMHGFPVEWGPVFRRTFTAFREASVVAFAIVKMVIDVAVKVIRAVIPRSRPDKDTAREPFRPVIAVGSETADLVPAYTKNVHAPTSSFSQSTVWREGNSMKKLAIGLYAAIVVALMAWGFYQAIYVAPDDAMQGFVFRIIYYHVPSAAVAFLFFAISLLGSIGYLAFRRSNPDLAQAADACALAGAEVGVVFCTVVLLTGPLWGRRAWGIWWTWDARLTTTLVLWLIYVSYLLLRRFASGPQMQTLAAVLGIFGALDVPIVYMSNRWWRTQHPAPVFGGGEGSGMAPSMKAVLGWNMLSWFAWGILILALRYQVERAHQKYASQEALEALESNV